MLLGIWVAAGWGKQRLLPANDGFHHGEDVTRADSTNIGFAQQQEVNLAHLFPPKSIIKLAF